RLVGEHASPVLETVALRRLAARALGDPDVEFLVDTDTAFHRTVLVAAHNDVLIELFDSFVPRVHRAMTDMLRARPITAPEEDQAAHLALVDAIADKDASAAAELSRAHLTALKEALS
ncbi:FCD domain-containing protein, partial [Amycolatopsis sp. NPDC000673]|uniref:FadR/GntR family transcriptional regulator n=1 Tax=Amycolatopsis sp. NPDC000673 TaxID=3154267 RepID=UPI00332B04C6